LKKSQYYIVVIFLALLPWAKIMGQGQEKGVIFTGIVVGGKNSEPLPRAYILNSSSGRGTIANESGYFILSVFPGDSIVFSYVGFKKQYHIIPKKIEQSYSAIVDLKEDVKMLAEVKVYPYATEELFKQAFIDTQLPDQKDREALARATDPRSLAMLAKSMGMSASSNYRYFMNQQQNAIVNKGYTNSISTALMNPIAWMSFIKSVKKGELSRKDWKGINDVAPNESISREKFSRENN
jgi:CarboxypepD_reg-like domain